MHRGRWLQRHILDHVRPPPVLFPPPPTRSRRVCTVQKPTVDGRLRGGPFTSVCAGLRVMTSGPRPLWKVRIYELHFVTVNGVSRARRGTPDVWGAASCSLVPVSGGKEGSYLTDSCKKRKKPNIDWESFTKLHFARLRLCVCLSVSPRCPACTMQKSSTASASDSV